MSSSGHMRQLYRTQGPYNLIYIVVPGVGTPDPEDWKNNGGESWLRSSPSLPSTGQKAVFVFEHGLANEESLTWYRIQTHGGRLLAQIQQLTQKPEFERCPIVLITHSLGGILLRRAISSAYRRGTLTKINIACMILFSCPFSKEHRATAWKSVDLILKAQSHSTDSDIVSPEFAESLADDCQDFLSSFGNVPILSVFEERPTQFGPQSWASTVIVDRPTALVGTQSERLVGVGEQHSRSCCLTANGREYHELQRFLGLALRFFPATHRSRSIDFSAYTTRMTEEPHEGSDISSELPPYNSPTTQSHLSRMFSQTSKPRDRAGSTTDYPESRPDPKLPCFSMPYDRNHVFNGRAEDIEAIATHLCSTPDASKASGIITYAVSGIGGVGKTQLAIEFVHQYRDEFDAVLWIPADDPGKMKQAFQSIAIKLGLVTKNSVEAKDKILTRDLVLGWLSKPLRSYKNGDGDTSEADWLVVFDNVEDPDTLYDFWPHTATGCVLITSREPLEQSHFVSTTVAHIADSKLTPFSEDETIALLLQLTRRGYDAEDMKHVHYVAKILGGLPLAITQMAGVIHRRNLAFKEFLDRYNDELRKRSLLNERVIFRDVYEHTLASVWGFEKLEKGKELLDVLSFFDPDGIPEYIFSKGCKKTDIGDFPGTDDEYEDARSELIKSSLITRHRGDKKLVIHRLIQDAARSQMEPARYSAVFTSVLQLISGVWPHQFRSAFKIGTDRWALCNELYGHIMHLIKYSDMPKLQPPKTFTAQRLEPCRVLLEAAWFSLMRSSYEDTSRLLDLAWKMFDPLQQDDERLQQQEESVREDFDEQARMFEHHPGVLALHINKPGESIRRLTAFKDRIMRAYGSKPKNQRQGVALNELGNAFLQNNRPDQAQQCFHDSIGILQSLPGETTDAVSMPRINLGFALWLQGKLQDAAETFQQALIEREDAYGSGEMESFATGKIYLGYGNVKAAQGLHDESFEMHKKCVDSFRATLGPYHHRTADGSVRLADHHIQRGELTQARILLEQARKVYRERELFVPERARLAFKQWQLASQLDKEEETNAAGEKAIELFRRRHEGDTRPIEELENIDFDNDIMFWSR